MTEEVSEEQKRVEYLKQITESFSQDQKVNYVAGLRKRLFLKQDFLIRREIKKVNFIMFRATD
jgi:hypothetical protein